MSEPAGGPGTPFRGGPGATPGSGYGRLIGVHRAPGPGSPRRGYLFTVALLAGTASMPILAAISAGSATMGNSALPDASTPFIPTPSVGPVVLPLPDGTQAPALPSRAPAATASPWPALAPPGDWAPGSHRRSRPAVPAPTAKNPGGATPAGSPRPSRVPSPSPSASESASPDPSPRPTGEPTSTSSDPPGNTGPEPDPTGSAGPPPPTGAPAESPTPRC